MSQCVNCGAWFEDDVRFCRKCGAKLPEKRDAQIPAAPEPTAAREYDPVPNYAPRNDPYPAVAQPEPPRSSAAYDNVSDHGSPWTIVAKITCVLLVLGAIGAGGFFGYQFFEVIGAVGGCVAGLIAGLIVVSGIMIVVRIADDVADSKRYLRAIHGLLKEQAQRR